MEPFRKKDNGSYGEKIFFLPGELVTIKHALPNKPVMLIKSKEQMLYKQDDATHFKGMRCIWFTTDGFLQEDTFSTKDLIHYKVEEA